MREIKFESIGEPRMKKIIQLDSKDWRQFTGLKDKNGKEIYEGDILEWTARDIDKTIIRQISSVEYKNGSFITDEESFYDDGNRRQITKQSKVIGNIYENSDLLEDKSNGV